MFRFFLVMFLYFATLNSLFAKCPEGDPFCNEQENIDSDQNNGNGNAEDGNAEDDPSSGLCTMKNFGECNHYLYMPDIKVEMRYLLLILGLLMAYFLPVIFYSSLLRSNYSAGTATSICLSLGCIFIALPTFTVLLSKKVYLDGTSKLVPFFKQTPNYFWLGGVLLFFIILTTISNQSKTR